MIFSVTYASYNHPIVPLLVFDTKGISATRRERIVTAVEAGGKQNAGET